MSLKKSRNSHTTLPNSLGELELHVMECVWDSTGIDAKAVVEQVSSKRPTTLSTVQTTLERLVRKGLLIRAKQGYAFLYSANVSRPELLGMLMKDVIGLLHDGKADTILSSFINVAAKIDDSALDRLERLIREKRRKLEGNPGSKQESKDDE